MKSILASTPSMDWSPESPMYGPGSVYEGQELAQVKVLSDRRPEGGGIAYLLHPTGHPHSAFIGSEVITLTICTGEPDEVRTIEVVPSEEDGATGS